MSAADALDRTHWVLDPASVPDGVEVTAWFEGGVVSGKAGCNRYHGRYAFDGERLSVTGPLATTLMACSPEVMEVEREVLHRLVAAARAVASGGELVLYDGFGTELLRFVAQSAIGLLGGWSVVSVHWPEHQAIVSVSGVVDLVFEDDGVHGSAGCNRFRGQWTADGTSIKIGPLVATLMQCADDVMAQELTVLRALQAVTTYRLEGLRLVLHRPDGGIGVALQRPGS
jgi:heat shock protein HslJ